MKNLCDGKYNRSRNWVIGIDKEISSLINSCESEIKITAHCRNNIVNNFGKKFVSYKRNYNINDITVDFLKRSVPVEVYVEGGIIKKVLFRGEYSFKKELCVVIAIDKDMKNKVYLTCLTAWINLENNRPATKVAFHNSPIRI